MISLLDLEILQRDVERAQAHRNHLHNSGDANFWAIWDADRAITRAQKALADGYRDPDLDRHDCRVEMSYAEHASMLNQLDLNRAEVTRLRGLIDKIHGISSGESS